MNEIGVKLGDLIKYDPAQFNWVVASEHISIREVNDFLAEIAGASGDVPWDQAEALIAQILPPIEQAIPYTSWALDFFVERTIGEHEAPYVAVEEDVFGMAWQTHPDAEVLFIRPSYRFTMVEFMEWDAGIEMPWRTMRRAGWNILQRMMRRTTDHIARQMDNVARGVMDVAIDALAGQGTVEAGATLSKATVDAQVKAATAMGFPMTRWVINSGTMTDMAGWTTGVFGTQPMPPARVEELIRNLHIGDYGGGQWITNPFAMARFLYMGGPAGSTGYHLVRGTVTRASDTDIIKKRDLQIVISAEHGFFIGNGYNLRKIRIAG